MDIPTFNGSARGDGVSPLRQSHGQAALLLVESLMHALLEKGVISREDFVETVDAAADVEHEILTADASSDSDSGGSLLYPLASAFRRELGR